MKKTKIKLSPIPLVDGQQALCFAFPDFKDKKLGKEMNNQNIVQASYEELNYENILSRTHPHIDATLNILTDQVEEKKEDLGHQKENFDNTDEIISNKLSSSRAQQDEENSINQIKEFATKTSRIFEDSETSRLNISVCSQRGPENFSLTNSSISSTYLIKQMPQNLEHKYDNNSAARSLTASPSKASGLNTNKSTRTTGEYPMFPVSYFLTMVREECKQE